MLLRRVELIGAEFLGQFVDKRLIHRNRGIVTTLGTSYIWFIVGLGKGICNRFELSIEPFLAEFVDNGSSDREAATVLIVALYRGQYSQYKMSIECE